MRFAVLHHDWPVPHLDLLLERNGVLRAWRLPADWDGREPIDAVAIADHRLAYLTYEGPVTGDRGAVIARDRGMLEWIEENDGELAVRLAGNWLAGDYRLSPIEGTSWRIEPITSISHRPCSS